MIRPWQLILSLLVACQCSVLLAQEAPEGQTKGRALLVGCTRYANLAEGLQLEGPGNDVFMMRDLLVDHFKLPAENIKLLAEEAGGALLRPTRANIEREFEQLTKDAQPGEQVVILMAGHGSQQPDQDPPSKDDPEPDGLDEIFLPADIGPWDDSVGKVENAIIDDELHVWLQKIQAKGASIWLIMDSCHSGTMSRDVGEVSRQVLPEKIVPAAELKKAQLRRAEDEKSRGRVEETASTLNLKDDEASLVAIYAAQSNEPTVEKFLPPGNAERKRRGLLTYTMAQILTQATEPMTYQELVQRVQAQYVAWNRTGPTPLIEGQDKDREVLGKKKWPGRSKILLSTTGNSPTVNAGALDGLRPGAVLAVYQTGTAPVGHVQVEKVRTNQADVKPCAYEMHPLAAELPNGSRCEVVFVDYGADRLTVALDPLDVAGQPIVETAKVAITKILRQIDSAPSSLVRFVENANEATWLVRIDEGKVILVPAANLLDSRAPFGPVRIDVDLELWLADSLSKIARAENLKTLAAEATDEVPRGDLAVKLEVKIDREAPSGAVKPVVWQRDGIKLHDGDPVTVHITNPGQVPIDVTVLYVDNAYGIDALFPESGESNRILPGDKLAIELDMNGTTTGLEHLIVIAVKGEGSLVDFSSLKQRTIEKQRGGSTPLGKLLNRAIYRLVTTRGTGRKALNDYALRLISWKVAAEKRPAEEPGK